jgi:hypothetical protein
VRKATAVTFVLVFFATALSLASAFLLRNVWAVLVLIAVVLFDVYAVYNRHVRKRRLRYPLVPPEGKPDWYLPTTDIPRPVIEDYRKIEEKKRRFARVRRMVYKAAKPKKK